MTDEAMSPLRRRMIEDMTIRKLAPKTQEGYIRTIKNFAAFLGRSPDTASPEEVRRFQLHLAENGAQAPILNHTVSALRFFFRVTLKRHEIIEHTTFIREPRKLPVVLSPEEVARLLNAAPGLKYKAALSVAYGAGLRACEVASLKVSDIDTSKRILIRVEQGKGHKDRNVMLSPRLLDCSAQRPRQSNPHSARATAQLHRPRFPPLEVFRRRPLSPRLDLSWGRLPKTFTVPDFRICKPGITPKAVRFEMKRWWPAVTSALLPRACSHRAEPGRALPSSPRGSCASLPHPLLACSAAPLPPSPSRWPPAILSFQGQHICTDRRKSPSKSQKRAHRCNELER